MNFKKEIQALKERVERLENAKATDQMEGYQAVTITFNGKKETWFLSEKEFTHYEALKEAERIHKTVPHAYEMLEIDPTTGKTRALLLSELGFEGCAWTADFVHPKSCYAYYVGLTNGTVYTYGRTSGYVVLCR